MTVGDNDGEVADEGEGLESQFQTMTSAGLKDCWTSQHPKVSLES